MGEDNIWFYLSSTNMMPPIPIDVLRLILEHADEATLAKICLLNRTCCSHSQDFLYRVVPIMKYRRERKLYQTLAESTCLARRVRSVDLGDHEYMDKWPAQKALQNMINLRHLRFGHLEDYYLLDGCTFTLDSFQDDYEDFEPLHQFLLSQPSLTKFELTFSMLYDDYDDFPMFDATVLPNLTRITTHFNLLQQLIPNRPVNEVIAYGDVDLWDPVDLSFFALSTAPIQKLAIDHSYLFSTPVTILASIFPSLTHLRMDIPVPQEREFWVRGPFSIYLITIG